MHNPLHHLGQTRSVLKHDHLLQTPDTFVRAPLPGMVDATAIVHVAPRAGADFLQYTAEIEPGGTLGPTSLQRFVYLLSGSAEIVIDAVTHLLTPGSFAYLPPAHPARLTAKDAVRAVIIEKKYVPSAGTHAPAPFIGREPEAPATALNGDPDLEVRTLLPPGLQHDFAVNTMSYQPGASLSMVEVHIMEHGLLMLEGGGIYRLGQSWYPVTAGDFIWMAPYCPQWFGALGKTPAKYLIYKDWNRHPSEPAL